MGTSTLQRRVSLLVAVASFWGLGSLLASPGAAQPSGDAWVFEQSEWRGKLPSGGTLEITNREGDLRVRGTLGDQIEVLAVTQRHVDDPRRAEIATTEGEGEAPDIAVEIVTTGGEDTALDDDWRKRRVDLTVLVPASALLTLTSDGGLIQAKGLAAPSTLRSAHGDITVSTRATLEVQNDHGDVQVLLQTTDWSTPPRLRTRTGAIRLRLPTNAGFRAELSTGGQITTDYSITIDRRPDSRIKQGRVVTNPEGPLIVLESQRGALKILESNP